MADEPKKKEKKAVAKNIDSLVEEISKLSVIELSELVNALQDKLGVSAMPVAAAPAAAPIAATETQAPAQGGGSATQTLNMTASGENKIAVIKALREINQNWGLKEAKDMTEKVPAEILKDAKADDVKAAADKLKAAGAQIELK